MRLDLRELPGPRTGRHQLPSGTTAGSGSRVRYATMGRAQVPLSGPQQSSTGSARPRSRPRAGSRRTSVASTCRSASVGAGFWVAPTCRVAPVGAGFRVAPEGAATQGSASAQQPYDGGADRGARSAVVWCAGSDIPTVEARQDRNQRTIWGRAPSARVSAAAPAHRIAHLCRVAPGPESRGPNRVPCSVDRTIRRPSRDRAAAGRRQRRRPRSGVPMHRTGTRDSG